MFFTSINIFETKDDFGRKNKSGSNGKIPYFLSFLKKCSLDGPEDGHLSDHAYARTRPTDRQTVGWAKRLNRQNDSKKKRGGQKHRLTLTII